MMNGIVNMIIMKEYGNKGIEVIPTLKNMNHIMHIIQDIRLSQQIL